MKQYDDIWYESSDGLKLYARDYNTCAGPKTDVKTDTNQSAIPLLCMHGLSRNSADFEVLADVLSEQYRVISVDQRGRGLSQWDSDVSRYTPLVYVQDMWRLLDHLNIPNVIAIGTSMGGLMGMMMAAQCPSRISGLILNDVGPEVANAGLQRIVSYVGKGKPVRSWDDAVAETRRLNEVCFPGYQDADWAAMAHRIYREDERGVPVLAYDPAISQPIAQTDGTLVPPDLWPVFEMLQGTTTMAIRGELSDLLSFEIFSRMQQVHPHMTAVEVPDVGHAPALDEPTSQLAIINFVEQLHGIERRRLC